MKKILSMLLILCILLCGCTGKNQDAQLPTQETIGESIPTVPASTEPEDESESSDEYYQQPMYAIALPVISELTHNDESTFIYQDIHLFCQNQEAADRIIVDYLNRLDAQRKTAQSTANINYQILYQPTRLDHGLVSLYGESVLHQNRNHPIIECVTMNYSMITGELLTLGSILKDSNAHEKLRDELVFAAETTAQEKQLYSDYPQIIHDRFSQNPSFDGDWFFTSTGLNFFFIPYEIAPYTSGVVTIEVPYERLVGIVDNRFFPGEEDLSKGTLNAASVENIRTEDYTQIAEVYINGYSNGVILFTEGLLRDVRIETLAQDEQIVTSTIFAANTLSPGDGITLMYDSAENVSTLRITYRSGAETVTHDLYFANDGTFVLT